jgi:hypothetical protein
VVIAIVVVAVLVLGGGGVAVWLLTRDDGSGSATPGTTGQTAGGGPTGGNNPTTGAPTSGGGGGEEALKTVAQSYFAALNKRDESAATQLTCEKSDPGALWEGLATDVKVTLDRVEMVSNTSATVFYKLQDSSSNASMPILMAFEDGAWCVST